MAELSATKPHKSAKKDDLERESVLFIGTQFSILYTSMYSPAEAATLMFVVSCKYVHRRSQVFNL